MNTYRMITRPAPPAMQVFHARHLIDGKWQEHHGGQKTERFSPAHGLLVSKAAQGTEAEVEAAVQSAHSAFASGIWSRIAAKERASVLLKVADLIEASVDNIAHYETLESGKPITQSRAEVSGAADLWRYAASLARGVQGDCHNTLGTDMLAMILKEPIGVVSIITPWNFPFWILSQKLPFALAAGCTCVVKPSEYTPTSTVMLGELLLEAGMAAGVVNIVLGHGQPVGALMAQHQKVAMISFTGSTSVGRHIAKNASNTLKKVALELGGKNPQVIFPDCDLEQAVDAAVFGTYFNGGQCCNASSRILVHEDIAHEITRQILALSCDVAFGDPLHEDTQVGAIVTPEHQAKINTCVRNAKACGAKILLGGETIKPAGLDGQFYAPTVVTDVTPDMEIAREEVFGPVLAILTFKTLEEAITIANDVNFGLSAGIWSDNIHNCLTFARRVDAGTIWMNTWMDGFPEVTFGGMKESGSGREIGSYGLEEFLEVKSVVMRIGRTRTPWVNKSNVCSDT